LTELGLLNQGGQETLPGTAEKENQLDNLSWVSRTGISPEERPLLEKTLKQAEALALLADQKAGQEDPVYSVAPTANRTRPGTEARISPLAETGQLLKSAPSIKGNYYKVASILE
jgi:aspartyl-tRNA synthetase